MEDRALLGADHFFQNSAHQYTVEDKPIEVLMTGQRPRATDLLVKIDATQLTTVIEYLRKDSHEAMSSEKRNYTKRKVPPA